MRSPNITAANPMITSGCNAEMVVAFATVVRWMATKKVAMSAPKATPPTQPWRNERRRQPSAAQVEHGHVDRDGEQQAVERDRDDPTWARPR